VTTVACVGSTSAQTAVGGRDESGADRTGAPITSPFTGITLKRIPAGAFLMGASENENKYYGARPEDYPQHRVRITRPFYLAVHEVTVAEFHKVVVAAGYRTEDARDAEWGSGWNEEMRQFEHAPKYTWHAPGFARTDDHPVTNVSWNDAIAFCNGLSAQQGLPPYYDLATGSKRGGTGYRLPTEAEWEYTCRAGTTTVYTCGNDRDALVTIGNIADASYKARYGAPALDVSDGYTETAPVGRFRPNAFDLYDMHGNVFEWCGDWYGADYYRQSPVDDPAGPPTGSERVFRGGCWSNFVQHARSAARRAGAPTFRYHSVGFRVARDAAAP
jgi:formylglycine-generating enzyme required for sulfatase activity